MSSTSNKQSAQRPRLIRVFLRGLLAAILVTFAAMVLLAWRVQTTLSKQNGITQLNNAVQYVSLALESTETYLHDVDIWPDEDVLAVYFASRLQSLSHGGLIIVEDGIIIGDSIEETHYHGLPLESTGIIPSKINKNEGNFKAVIEDAPYLCVYKTLPQGVTIIALMREDVLYSVRNTSLMVLSISFVLLFTALFLVISRLLRRSVVSGITEINTSLQKITDGQLDEVVCAEENREFALLSQGINQTVDALKEAIQREAGRIDQELLYAQAIQKSALPGVESVHDSRFLLAAEMHPAKNVGGDFYDFFFLDPDTLCLMIADVSGNGIPAALYMMSTMGILKNALRAEPDFAKAIERANNELSQNNSQMFVTLFAAKIHLPSGRMTSVNAGHNSPLLQKDGDGFAFLPEKHNLVLGGMENSLYTAHQRTLHKGDTLFLYTDGVTESRNNTHQWFGDDPLQSCLAHAQNKTPAQLVAQVYQTVLDFSAAGDPFDDITLLAFRLE